MQKYVFYHGALLAYVCWGAVIVTRAAPVVQDGAGYMHAPHMHASPSRASCWSSACTGQLFSEEQLHTNPGIKEVLHLFQPPSG